MLDPVLKPACLSWTINCSALATEDNSLCHKHICKMNHYGACSLGEWSWNLIPASIISSININSSVCGTQIGKEIYVLTLPIQIKKKKKSSYTSELLIEIIIKYT